MRGHRDALEEMRQDGLCRERATAFTAGELRETFARYYPEDANTVVTLLPAEPGTPEKGSPR